MYISFEQHKLVTDKASLGPRASDKYEQILTDPKGYVICTVTVQTELEGIYYIYSK